MATKPYSPACSGKGRASPQITKAVVKSDPTSRPEIAPARVARRQTDAVFASDDHIVTACVDGNLRVWNAETGQLTSTLRGHTGSVWDFVTTANQSPYVGLGLAGDTTLWRRWGPHKGARWEARYNYGYDLDDGGTLTSNVELDARAYVPLSQRNELAFRFWAGYANGNQPWVYSFGGLDTLRGFPTRSLSGNRTTFANIEWRFPLVDRMDLAFLRLGGIRGRLFFDIGAAWWELDGVKFNMFGEPGFNFIEDGRLVDGVSSYGFGLDVNLFGLPMHWDWVKIWNLKETLQDTQVQFWIGARF